MSKSRAPYPIEFPTEAAQLARTRSRPNAESARDVGMTAETLRIWLKQAAVDEGRLEGLTTEERDELRRLQRDNCVLRFRAGDPTKSRGRLRHGKRHDTVAVWAFIEREKATHSVPQMCQILEVSPRG